MKLHFNIHFNTKVGQSLQLVLLEDGAPEKAYPLSYQSDGIWSVEFDFFSKSVSYKYEVLNVDNQVIQEEFVTHDLCLPHNFEEFYITDYWNLKNFPENYLTNKILKLHASNKLAKLQLLKRHTHLFRLEAPIYNSAWQVVLLGNVPALGNWEYLRTVPLTQTSLGVWETAVEIIENQQIEYKYGLMDIASGHVFDVENGENRHALPRLERGQLRIQADHYFKFKSFELYHAAGVAVPVFALRSKNSFGVGEFADLKLLGGWSREASLSIVQILPINDTTANYSWTDSYPYAAISVYALHPQYLAVENLDFPIPDDLKDNYNKEKETLNSLDLIDYEKVIASKWHYTKCIFDDNQAAIFRDRNFKKFIKENNDWLLPYAAFCFLRDKYGTPNFNEWKTHKKFISGKISAFFKEGSKEFSSVMLHAWVQYQLHNQLTEAVDYLHQIGIAIKGDLPIGIYRYSVEAWAEPQLFGMDFQAGAPPDQFTELGQNWGFPTYNWEAMKGDGCRWWKNRFRALEQYFDAMRIDHILGFFRIWRIPVTAVQGILGYFYPAVPVTLEEFAARNIPFDRDRYCKPFINQQILKDFFGDSAEQIADFYLENHFDGSYSFKNQFDTQRKLQDYFDEDPHPWAQNKLLALSANVLFLEEECDGETVYHPRFSVASTESYKYLNDWEKASIFNLYNDYFFHRQNALWYGSAMEKLPPILNATKMLICGEDLGLVPAAVPLVMDELGITALKVQRMPSDDIPWYDPKNAGYLNVVTASSHDSSTLRQWWQEDRALSQRYFVEQLNQYGTAPWELHPQLAEIIMKQHLYNEAMLAIFPIQEFLATDEALKNSAMGNERINNPAVFPHYWRYRMHIGLEDLIGKKEFSQKISHWVQGSGRVLN